MGGGRNIAKLVAERRSVHGEKKKARVRRTRHAGFAAEKSSRQFSVRFASPIATCCDGARASW